MLMPASHPWVMKAFCMPISWEFEPSSRTTASSVSQMQQVYSPTSFWRPHSKTQTQLFVFLTQGKHVLTEGNPNFFKKKSYTQTGKYCLTRAVIREGERRPYQTCRPKKRLRDPKCYHRRTIQTPSLQTKRDQCVLPPPHALYSPRQSKKKKLTYLTQSPLSCFQDLPIAKVSISLSERLLEYVPLSPTCDLSSVSCLPTHSNIQRLET